MAHLFEYSPLVVKGRPLLGGLPTKTKRPGSFFQTWRAGQLKWEREGKRARPQFDLELDMVTNPSNYPDIDTDELRRYIGEE